MHFKSNSVILDHLNLLKINSQHFLAMSRNDTSAIKPCFQKNVWDTFSGKLLVIFYPFTSLHLYYKSYKMSTYLNHRRVYRQAGIVNHSQDPTAKIN